MRDGELTSKLSQVVIPGSSLEKINLKDCQILLQNLMRLSAWATLKLMSTSADHAQSICTYKTRKHVLVPTSCRTAINILQVVSVLSNLMVNIYLSSKVCGSESYKDLM